MAEEPELPFPDSLTPKLNELMNSDLLLPDYDTLTIPFYWYFVLVVRKEIVYFCQGSH